MPKKMELLLHWINWSRSQKWEKIKKKIHPTITLFTNNNDYLMNKIKEYLFKVPNLKKNYYIFLMIFLAAEDLLRLKVLTLPWSICCLSYLLHQVMCKTQILGRKRRGISWGVICHFSFSFILNQFCFCNFLHFFSLKQTVPKLF